MSIEYRDSNEYLHTSVILSKITEYDIFRHYCPNFKEVGEKFCSDLREDNSPTVSITLWNNKLLYKDFGRDNHSFDCFSYVSFKYGLNFIETLSVISNDFGLGLASKTSQSVAITYGKKTFVPKLKTIIKVKFRAWDKQDASYWGSFCISKQLLTTFGVYPIEYYWINETRFKCNTLSYVFCFNSGYKIYRPFETEFKWFSNTNKETIQGYNQLPANGEIVFLTSSLKDVMCLEVLGYPSVALQSEMCMPDEKTIQSLNERFKQIVVLYDNDYTSEFNPGQSMARKICDKYDLKNLYIPATYESKDISDLIKNHGKHDSFNLIKQYL
jgi:hypothetical protein